MFLGDVCMKKVLIVLSILIIIVLSIFLIFFRDKKEEPIVEEEKKEISSTIKIVINETMLDVSLENNRSTEALVEKLNEGDITINAHDYSNFEKVGNLDFKLPRSDKYIKTEPGDVILYNGNQIAIYYDTNTWNFTRIGKIDITQEELKNILGEGDITFIITK